MDTTTAIVATGVIVAVGRWSQEKRLDARILVGVGATSVFLALIGAENEGLASQFALLILVSAALVYGVDISKKLRHL